MSYRLPATVVPTRYDIRLEPDLEAAAFSGEETIAVTVREPVQEVVLNAAELDVSTATIEDDRGVVMPGTPALDPAVEQVRLAFPRGLDPGEWRLRIAFTGTLNDKLRGFYRSTYKDAEGRIRPIATTQFEAVDARRAFPCWDEPARKAVFSVTLVVPDGLVAVSNTQVLEERPAGPGRRAVRFADTIPMSTYLVAFLVGAFEASEPVMVGKTPLRVYCVPGKRHLTGFALEAGAFCLGFFERYYGLAYPGDKLDLLAVPDFAAGAMENLGAITFRENALLVDVAAASHAELERVADVVAHEIAHMWFGDLVTMAWWNGIWLNEAFATFMEMLAVDAWRPEWRRWVTFGVSRAAAMGVDGLVASRPIEFPVEAPRDCEAMFDLLTYEKGASVLRMLEQHLGADTFRDGVRGYLVRHRYGNAETTDLWRALGQRAGQPIPEVMGGWIFRAGYPLVSVEADGPALQLSQRRFTYVGDAADVETWRVPITFRTSVGGRLVEQRVLLDQAATRVALPAQADWVVVNAGGHGFYRVRYAPPLLDRLLSDLASLAPIERFNLVSDSFALAQAGLAPATGYLDLTARFRDETDRNVWIALLGAFAYLARIIDEASRPGLAALVRDRLRLVAARLGWDPAPGEDELQRQLRGDVLRVLGTLGDDPGTQAEARRRYARYLDEEGSLDPNVLPAVIAVLAFAGGEAEYADFFDRFRRARTPQEEQRYLYALAGFRQPALIRETLARTLDTDVRTQDAPYLVRALLGSVYARGLAWEFVKANWEAMARRYPLSAYRRMYEGVTALVSPAWEAEVRAFFPANRIELGGKTLAQYLEQLHVAVRFQVRDGATLVPYLARP
jgi:puromycin-sensitive aminopeptidase